MTHTVEDAFEILAGIGPRLINIRLSYKEKTLIRSIGRQINNNLALTDRQLELVLKKIEKYRENLLKNGIDVDYILQQKPLRMPLRQIDRSKKIFISINENNRRTISVKFSKNKDFFDIWDQFQETIIGAIVEKGSVKEIPFNEINVMGIVKYFADKDFDIDEEIFEIFKKIEKILEEPTTFAPYLDWENGKLIVRNANKNCHDYIEQNIKEKFESNPLHYVDRLKNCGIFHKNSQVIDKISQITDHEVCKTILQSTATRFRVDPESIPQAELLKIIDTLNQWPILVLVEDDHKAYDQVLDFYSAIKDKISQENITVFFRIDSKQKNANEFNQFVRENHLNNFIGPHTQVVFITKNKIPKPLLRADWKPYAAISFSSHDYGKTSAFLDDFPTVYYYNKSVFIRNNKIKGARQIVQL